MEQEVTGRLELWKLGTRTVGYPKAVPCVRGFLYDDARERWIDGEWITTSKLKSKTTDCVEGAIIETKNSRYLLGKPSEE